MQGYGAGPGAPGMTRNVAKGGYPSQQGGGKGAPPAGGAATGAAQMAGMGQQMQRPGMAGAMAGMGQQMQNQQNPMAQRQQMGEQVMRGVQGMRRPNEFPEEMQQMAPLLMQQLLSRGITGR